MRSLQLNDAVMVRDVRRSESEAWQRGRIIGVKNTDSGDVLTVQYRDNAGKQRTVTVARFNCIIMPMDEDVATVLAFGDASLPFLKDFRICK